jgi:hypothetical protein
MAMAIHKECVATLGAEAVSYPSVTGSLHEAKCLLSTHPHPFSQPHPAPMIPTEPCCLPWPNNHSRRFDSSHASPTYREAQSIGGDDNHCCSAFIIFAGFHMFCRQLRISLGSLTRETSCADLNGNGQDRGMTLPHLISRGLTCPWTTNSSGSSLTTSVQKGSVTRFNRGK